MNDLTHTYLDAAIENQSRSPTGSQIRLSAMFKWLAILLSAALLATGTRLWANYQAAQSLDQYTQTLLQKSVLVTHANPGALTQKIRLPTSLRGDTEAAVYARITGYLTTWHKGIGDLVNKGELLAVIDTPELEQELAQAKAQRQQIHARLGLAQQTLARWEQLGARNGAATEQDLAEKRSLLQQVDADLAAADANVRRLEQQQEFRHITAPFAGVITRRSVEVGDLIRSAGQELFALAATDPLRLTVWIPQSYAHQVRVGQPVKVQLKEQPGADYTATIERLAGGLDPRTRSRQADLVLTNPDNQLLPGAYAEVNFELATSNATLVVPPAVLFVNAKGPQVVVLDKENRVQFREIKLGRDLGKEVEIIAGITAEDTLVVSPSDQLQSGEVVEARAWGG
jgi:multidrug efflux system membrane fusion protein